MAQTGKSQALHPPLVYKQIGWCAAANVTGAHPMLAEEEKVPGPWQRLQNCPSRGEVRRAEQNPDHLTRGSKKPRSLSPQGTE